MRRCARWDFRKTRLRATAFARQLAHSVHDRLGSAYNRTEFVEQRRKLQARADYLDRLRRGPHVAPLRSGRRRRSRTDPGVASWEAADN
jgi:hypothetical protein